LRDMGGRNSLAGALSIRFIASTPRGSGAGRGSPEKRLVNRSGADGMTARYICQDIATYRI
jgi:hypothetical protein